MNIISNKIDELKEDLLSDIIDIVKIPSVRGESENGFPFGEKVGYALNKALEISEKLGFKVTNLDNYIGYAEYGDSEDYVCVIGHVDVVHEGEGWKYHPYKGEETNGRIYGRGVLDNKGPIMSALYGLYAIKELNLKLDKRVRIIFGTNEESGFEDIPYYLEKEKAPIMGFTPDCKYPVVYGEKGMAKIRIKSKSNYEEETFLGFIESMSENVFVTYKELNIENSGIILDIKVKYDFSYKLKDVLDEIKSSFPNSIEIEVISNFNPVYFDKESNLVKKLQLAYERVTSLDGTPVTTNGGTYAKVMPNIVPFGPSFPGQKGIAHNPDEYMDIEDIILNAKIFANAIYELAKE
ncbi:TPA: Sapep family Mn(2+)-dependent dipeptidase [Clostridioides difficile]|uniref:Sapep family Mn(2+)-dependent dipeptidase n=1 Tax=Clostridioides difficile TaxID=1496 RepID=UPI00097FF917|nr:Sapep family Mn(2+)-dependent dipeptidase [Clostridioides difficile]MCV2271856.1 Sapep family Mn(2+)-dependent dipeptidase [Clostridioides difficile]MDV9708747.1 Sapep family Mn(2+)-dependent dipeptidase [Clostridioides difficile]SJP65087.1 Beta-Ala-Xaa dipeptidase [Clostridioides difficile]SJT26552.1 Beta-Ala-Xaa dipeptidase [Clostridioides difficile]SJT56298.1 Beta-Ala-Xaa dipeptidase [Clostridioides difficile]